MTAAGGGAEAGRDIVARGQGCLLGQLAGDSLGGLVEFRSKTEIRALYPDGIRLLADGGTHHTIAGQPTDDSEMALALARSIVATGGFEVGEAAVAYARWFASHPFDYGTTTASALRPAAAALAAGESPACVAEAARSAASRESQANGALMRVSPLAIYAHALAPDEAADLARQDAALTHPHHVCLDAGAVFVVATAYAIKEGVGPRRVYQHALEWSAGSGRGAATVHPAVRECLESACAERPRDYETSQGWVLIALGNAFWQLLHARSVEEGLADTILAGGDTDTNAAVCGALLGAVHGAAGIPTQWKEALAGCRPEAGAPGVRRPRPPEYWPHDALDLAAELVRIGRG